MIRSKSRKPDAPAFLNWRESGCLPRRMRHVSLACLPTCHTIGQHNRNLGFHARETERIDKQSDGRCQRPDQTAREHGRRAKEGRSRRCLADPGEAINKPRNYRSEVPLWSHGPQRTDGQDAPGRRYPYIARRAQS